MQNSRRGFLRSLLGSAGLVLVPQVATAVPRRQLLIQESSIAGFQYHQGETAWPGMKIGDALTLVRQSHNPHDARAVAVYWRDAMIGFVPRAENTAVAQMLDRGEPLCAAIIHLKQDADPWQRVFFSITHNAHD